MRKRLWLVARAGWLTSLLLGGSVVPAGAFGQAPPFVVSPTEGAPYTVVNVSGAGCTEGPVPSVSGSVFRPDTGAILGFVATADPNGDWSTTFRPPPTYPPGVYEVRATCVSDPNRVGADVFQYAPQSFTLLAGETPVATASPLHGVVGRETVISVSGNLCLGSLVEVSLFRLPFELHDLVAQEFPTPDAEGNWAAQLTVAPTQPAGTFSFRVMCELGLSFFFYDLPDFVLGEPGAPPATPVTRQPTFTG